MAKKLTKRQQVFVAEYFKDMNATRAAIAAGYSKKSAESQGSQLLKHPKVSAEIAKKSASLLGKAEITAEKVLEEIGNVAFLDPRKFLNPDGTLKEFASLDADVACAIAGFEVSETGNDKKARVRKIRLADKLKALELYGRYFKLFADKLVLAGRLTLEDLVTGDKTEGE